MSKETNYNQTEDETINDVVEDMGAEATQIDEKAQPEAPNADKKKLDEKAVRAAGVGVVAGAALGMFVKLFPDAEGAIDRKSVV